jgi:hypothetical protein
MAESKGKNWINIQELKASIMFEQVLERLELLPSLERAGDELRGQCPICKRGDESSKSFSVNVSKQVFQCFACKRRGNVLDFAAAVRGQDVHHAALWLRDEFLTNRDVPKSEQPEEEGSNGFVRQEIGNDNSGGGNSADRNSSDSVDRHCIRAAMTPVVLTDHDIWLIGVIATGIAWYLAETFKAFSDVTSIQDCIVAKINMVAGMDEAQGKDHQ